MGNNDLVCYEKNGVKKWEMIKKSDERGFLSNLLLDKDGELLRLIEVGASCFNHYCADCDHSSTTSYTVSTGV